MSAVKILDLAEEQGLLEAQVLATLRRQVAAKPKITAEIVAKTLVDKGLLTAFQAKKLLAAALAATKPPEPELDLTLDVPLAPEPPPDDDVVMLEAVEPAPAPVPKPVLTPVPKPAAPAAAPKPAQPRAEKPKPQPATKPQPTPIDLAPVDLAPVDLAPVDLATVTSPPPSSPEPLVDLAAFSAPPPTPGPAAAPAPLGAPAAGGMDDLLSPLPSLGSADPFAAPDAGPLGAPAEPKPEKPGVKKRVGRANVWDSPLLLIGGGGLLVMIIAFVVLYFALTRGTASEVFEKANEEYRNSQYAAAMVAFDKFIEKYPTDPLASQAKVLRGMAQLRQASDNADKDPRSALKAAQAVLPTIEREPSFADIRDQLASILPDIADGFAEQAKATDQMSRKIELAKQADESMELVNNPSYLPASQRKNLEARIANILDKLSAARRSIDQDKDLQTAITNIQKLVGEGKTAESYQVRTDLVRRFPGLEQHSQLIEATLTISERERQAVRLSETPLAAATDDARPAAPRIVLASRSTSGGAAIENRPVFVIVEGAVYGVELGTGKILWRRYVGYDSQLHPLPVSRAADADVLVADTRSHDLYRLEAATGKVRWRLPVGEPFLQPVLAEDKLLVAASSGTLLEVNLTSGASDRRLVLPQKITVPPAYDAKNARIYQLGEHSTLFVINASLACEETYYIGHKAGAILIPPVVALDQVLVTESPGDDYSLLHVFGRDPASKKLQEIDRGLRLKGRVVMPLGVSGRRITCVTDLGEVNAFEIDPAIKDQPLQLVGKIEASEAVPTVLYQATDGSRLWLAGRRCTMYEIQVSLQQLGRKWTTHQDDAFLAPPQVHGETLLHIRRRPNSAAVLIEACQVADGKPLWTTQVAAPLVGLMADMERKQFIAITSQGRVFEVPPEGYAAGYYDQPVFSPPPGTGVVTFRNMRKLPDGRWLSIGGTGSSYALFYDPSAASDRTRFVDLGSTVKDLAAPAALYKQGLILPLATGRVELLDPTTIKPLALPFQPPLAPGARIAWNEPAVLSGDRAVVIGDGKQTVYRIALKEGAQPALSKEAEARVEGDLMSPAAAAGDFVYVIVREATGDSLQLLQAGNLAAGAKLPLGGRYKSGPVQAGDKVYVELQERKLLCFDQDRQSWSSDLARGPLSARPQLLCTDLLLVHAGGAIVRVNPADGKETGVTDLGEPLGEVVTEFGARLLVGGRDGVLQIATPPPAATPSASQ